MIKKSLTIDHLTDKDVLTCHLIYCSLLYFPCYLLPIISVSNISEHGSFSIGDEYHEIRDLPFYPK